VQKGLLLQLLFVGLFSSILSTNFANIIETFGKIAGNVACVNGA